MAAVSVLLVGAGGFGRVYVQELLSPRSRENNVALAGVVDPFIQGNREIADALSAGKIPVFHTLDEFYKSSHAELVVVSSPIHLHGEHVITSLANNSFVLCEKPLAATVGDAEKILDAEKRAGKRVAVGYQLAYNQTIQALKRDILSGLFGRPLSFKTLLMYRRGQKYYMRNNWAGKIAVNGTPVYDSPLANACAHEMQNMLFLAGKTMRTAAEVTGAQAKLFRINPLAENYDAAAVRCGSTARTDFHFYTNLNIQAEEFGPFVECIFENAVIRSAGWSDYTAVFHNGKTKTYPFQKELRSFAKLYAAAAYARGGDEPMCTAETAFQHTRLVNMVQAHVSQAINVNNTQNFTADGDEFVYSQECNDLLWDCYQKGVLPGSESLSRL